MEQDFQIRFRDVFFRSNFHAADGSNTPHRSKHLKTRFQEEEQRHSCAEDVRDEYFCEHLDSKSACCFT